MGGLSLNWTRGPWALLLGGAVLGLVSLLARGHQPPAAKGVPCTKGSQTWGHVKEVGLTSPTPWHGTPVSGAPQAPTSPSIDNRNRSV